MEQNIDHQRAYEKVELMSNLCLANEVNNYYKWRDLLCWNDSTINMRGTGVKNDFIVDLEDLFALSHTTQEENCIVP